MEMKKTVIPYSCLEDLKEEFREFAKRDDLNDFQKTLLNERYNLDPKTEFEPKTLVLCAVPLKLYKAAFTEKGKRFESIIDKGEDTEKVIAELSKDTPYRFYFDFWIPVKRMAVRAGLCEYGRNNITYAGEYGSLAVLYVFVSDMPCPEKYVWREVANMPECEKCTLCLQACPTGAISKDRFLIDNERCLSFWNEFGTRPFPDWIPSDAHHRLTDCSICQKACPKNKGKYDAIAKTVEFTEEETKTLLAGTPLDALSPSLRDKVTECNMTDSYETVPRNLRALIDATILKETKE